MEIWAIMLFFILWLLKIISSQTDHTKEDSESEKSVRLVIALLYPVIMFAMVSAYNTWGRFWIGWPPVTGIKEFLVLMLFF